MLRLHRFLVPLFPRTRKRQGKAPIELLTGQSLEAPWWELLRQQLCTEKGVIDHDPLPLPSPLQLVVNHDRVTDRQERAPGQTSVDSTGASENHRRHKDFEAA
jgi:hypothetical protein